MKKRDLPSQEQHLLGLAKTKTAPVGKASLLLFLLSSLLWLLPEQAAAQAISLSLSQATERAIRNYPLLARDQQHLEQLQLLLESAGNRPRTNVYIAGTQVDPNSPVNGVHGVGLLQAFNWPGYKKRRAEFLQQQQMSGNAQLELSTWELRRELAIAYFELLYAKDARAYYNNKQALMEELQTLAQVRFELGDTGKIPVLSAKGKQREATMEHQQAKQSYELAQVIFNNWLYSDTLFTAMGPGLPAPSAAPSWFVNGGHPLLLTEQQDVRLAEAEVLKVQSELLPQIIVGGQLQLINENLPFMAYQLGLSVPLGQKAARARIQAAHKEIDMQQTELDAAQRQLDNFRRELLARLNQAEAQLDYLQAEMLPLAEEQIDAARRAYAQGAVDYPVYLINLEQALQSRLQYLQALRQYHLIRLELDFLSGRR